MKSCHRKKTLIQQWSRDWWRHHPRCDMKRYFMANAILLLSDILLRIKLSKLYIIIIIIIIIIITIVDCWSAVEQRNNY